MAARYLTAPQLITSMPPGIPYIIGNEAAERFSFYGMKAILTVYMTQSLMDWDGNKATLSPEDAKSALHLFVASAYFFPLFGAIIADWILGKYRTILSLSVLYCLGHLALAAIPGREGLAVGLTLIAIGAGGIKPCVSAHVGDQFGERNQHLISRIFSWFYFSINTGAFLSTLLTPYLLRKFGPHVAFGLPGILMAVATFVFWLGRNHFVHIPPGGKEFLYRTFSREGLLVLLKLAPVYLFVSVFWALFDQTGSAWVLQAEQMDRQWLGVVWDESQIQAANPLLVLAMIPLFSYVVYPLLDRILPPLPLWRMSIGLFIMVAAFALSAMIETWITSGLKPNISWQLWAYVLLTASEIMVSITCLEFSYTQAPNSMKSLIMSCYLLSVTMGNAFTSLVNQVIQNPDGTNKLPGATYYWFFTILMGVAAVGFVFVAALYRPKTHIQGTPEGGDEPDTRQP